MNYFNYFTEIEDAFVRRRGKHLMLSPMDWALIESWKEIDVPLHVVLRGVEKAFDSWESKPRKRTVKSLLYCQEEVEAQYAEWREARVGAADEAHLPGGGGESAASGQNLPFSRNAVLEHLQNGRGMLKRAFDERRKSGEDDFSDAIERAIRLVDELQEDFKVAALPDAQKLETSLTGVERMLSDALRVAVDPDRLSAVESEVNEQMKPYRKQMEPAIYQQTRDNLLLKRLREQFGVPRLSLFYL